MAKRTKTATTGIAQAASGKTSVAASGAKKRKPAKTAPVEVPEGKYIDLRTDFGFKHIFGDKEFLMNFLNAVLKIKGGIVDLHYDNPVKPGRFESDRTTIFDLYCKTKTGESILIEMQNARQEHFRDRTLYYASRLIQEQGEDKTGQNWDFRLSSVYSVNIVDFWLTGKKSSDGQYVSYVQLYNVKTRKVFHDRLTFVFLELPCFTKEVHELKGIVEQWMYVLRNLSKLNELPEPLRNRIFEKLFLKAEIAKLSDKDRKNYNQSLKNYRDMYSVLAERDYIIKERDQKIVTLSKDNAVLSKNVAVLSRDNAEQRQRIAELERILQQSNLH